MRKSVLSLLRYQQLQYMHRSLTNFKFLLTLLLQVQASVNDLAKFQRIVKMVAFHPFDSAENALENINAVTEHEMTADLRVCYFAA